jgi:hypothetical protein
MKKRYCFLQLPLCHPLSAEHYMTETKFYTFGTQYMPFFIRGSNSSYLESLSRTRIDEFGNPHLAKHPQ